MSPRTFVTRAAAVFALAAIGLAACESKTIVQPSQNPLQIVVTPAAVTLTAIGGTAQLAAVVTGGPAGTATTVTWQSGNSAVVTVDNTGKLTAVAQGATTVTATATADPNVKAAASVIVAPGGAQTVPAAVSIASITKNDGSTVNNDNVFEEINVLLNVDAGVGNNISAVNWLIDGKTFCTQSFTQGASAGASVEATQATVQMSCQLNTAKLDSVTFLPLYANGQHTISATMVSGTTIKATTSQVLIFNNVNKLKVSAAGAQTKPDATGLLWNGGNLTVKVTPTIFDAQVLQTVTVAVNDDENDLTATKTIAVTSNAPITIVFKADSTAANAGVQNFEDATTEVGVTGAVTSAGQNFNGTLGDAELRFDAKAPVINVQPTYLINTVGGTSWLDMANNKFKTACTGTYPTFTCQLTTTVTDAGVDVVTATFQISPNTATKTWTSVTAASALVNTAANADVARLNICDNLGNCSQSTTSAVFGIDVTPPIVEAVTAISGVKVAPQTIAVSAVDSLSGFDLTNGYIQVQITKDSAKSDGSDVKTCVNASTGATTALPGSGTCAFNTVTPAAGLTQFAIPVGTNGYFTVVLQTADIAGNVSTQTTRFFLMDAVAPTTSGLGVTFTTGSPTIGVNGTIQDNVDLQQYAAYETFAAAVGGASAIPFAAPTVVKAFGIPVNGKVTTTATVPTILSVQAGWAGVVANSTGFGFGGLDQANNFTLGLFPLALTGAGVTATDVVAANSLFSVDNANVCGAADPTDCAAGDKTSVTATQLIVMNNTTTANPIVKVYFYYNVTYGATTVAKFIGTVATPAPAIPSDGANQNLRVYTYTAPTVAASNLVPPGTSFMAIGVDKDGNGILLGGAAVTVFVP